jgi:hypothetical protein
MNIRDDDQVSAVALVVESEASTAATVVDDEPPMTSDAEAPPAVDEDPVDEDPVDEDPVDGAGPDEPQQP